MVFCWTTEQSAPEQSAPEQKLLEDFHDFDDILAVRTPTSWDQDEDVFENDNDVSPDSSIGEPEEIEEDAEIYVEEPKTCVTNGSCSLFSWPFSTPVVEQDEARQSKDTATNASDRLVPSRGDQNTEAVDLPFDERIPPSDGVVVPFDECPFTVESDQITGRSFTVEKESEVERDNSVKKEIQEKRSPLADESGNFERLEPEDEEDGYIEKEIAISAIVSTQRPQVGLSKPTSNEISSVDDLVNNIKAANRRIEALLDENEEFRRMASTSVMTQKSTNAVNSEVVIMKKPSVDRELKDMKIVDEFAPVEVEPLGPALSDGIEECRTMDSTGSNVKRSSSIEYTDSLIRKLSTDNDCLVIPDDDEVDEDCYRAVICGIPMIGEGKMFHPPSSSRKKSLITKDMDNLEDPSFDEMQRICSIDSANSIRKTSTDEPMDSNETSEITHKLETIDQEPPKSTILKKAFLSPTPSGDADMSVMSASKKVSFAEELYETCPSNTSDLDFDYMKHHFDGEEGKGAMYDEASVGEESIEDHLFEESEYVDKKHSPWFSLLLQAK